MTKKGGMKNALALLALSTLSAGCGLSDDVKSLAGDSNDNLIWIWAQFNVPIKNSEIDNYYYYGRVPEELFNKVSSGEIDSGFILLRDIRYWGKDDLIHAFKDRENTGDILFRIEDMRRVELIANEPIVGRGNEQFEDQQSVASSTASTSASDPKN